uniref:Uncharacterized protein n=1 Tax=Arundo donax TaxID=35708 RepID=A0A0A9FJ75_ARUDO
MGMKSISRIVPEGVSGSPTTSTISCPSLPPFAFGAISAGILGALRHFRPSPTR